MYVIHFEKIKHRLPQLVTLWVYYKKLSHINMLINVFNIYVLQFQLSRKNTHTHTHTMCYTTYMFQYRPSIIISFHQCQKTLYMILGQYLFNNRATAVLTTWNMYQSVYWNQKIAHTMFIHYVKPQNNIISNATLNLHICPILYLHVYQDATYPASWPISLNWI